MSFCSPANLLPLRDEDILTSESVDTPEVAQKHCNFQIVFHVPQ